MACDGEGAAEESEFENQQIPSINSITRMPQAEDQTTRSTVDRSNVFIELEGVAF